MRGWERERGGKEGYSEKEGEEREGMRDGVRERERMGDKERRDNVGMEGSMSFSYIFTYKFAFCYYIKIDSCIFHMLIYVVCKYSLLFLNTPYYISNVYLR